MYAKQLAIAALGMTSGAMAIGCSDPTATISSAADATALASCTSFGGSVVMATSVAGVVDMSGQLTQIGGDFTVFNASQLISLSSSSIRKIGGEFRLEALTLLSTLNFGSLSSVKTINWKSLPQLGTFTTTGNGVVEAESVTISDTFINTLEGINVRSIATLDINNNKRLTKFTTQLSNLTDTLYLNNNGLNLDAQLPNLIWMNNASIANVTSFSAPSLAAINGSMRFDSNYFQTFNAPNLTMIDSGDLSFVSNPQLTNISCPMLQRVGGGFTIANNTALQGLNGFPALTEVGGAVILRGSFKNATAPKLNDVKGAFAIVSTEDITSTCSTFQKLKDGGQIQGQFTCDGKNANANNDTSGASGSGNGGGSGSGNKPGNAAAPMSASLSTVITLAALGALVTAFL